MSTRTGSIGSRVPPAVTSTVAAAQRPVAAPVHAEHRGDDPLGAARRPGALVATGEAARLGLDDDARPGARDSRLSCDAGCSHISVCIAGQTTTGRGGGEEGGGEQVVREARGVAREQVGRGGRDDDDVGPLPEAGVRDRVVGVAEQRRPGGLRRERGEGEGRRRTRVAASVSTGATSQPASVSRRQTSTAL